MVELRTARGFSLIEGLVALAMVAATAVALLPAMITHMDANGRDDLRSGAVGAAQERLEALRLQDPASMPASGTSAPQLVRVDGRTYEVVTHYCERPEFCGGSTSRHLRVEVKFDGRTIYDVETVYTRLL